MGEGRGRTEAAQNTGGFFAEGSQVSCKQVHNLAVSEFLEEIARNHALLIKNELCLFSSFNE